MSHKARCYGTPEGIRTPDLLVRSQTLYPAELIAQNIYFFKTLEYYITIKIKNQVFISIFFLSIIN